MSRLAFALLLAAICAPALAAEVPQSSRHDRRIQYVNYNPGDVVVVRALPGLGVRIVFSPGEEILDKASGFSAGWEIADRRNILYVKPKSIVVEGGEGGRQVVMEPESGKWNTNLMVTTNLRMYDLDLVLLPGGGNDGKPALSQPVAYRVEFRYPADESAKARAAASKQEAKARLSVTPPPHNWHYAMQIGSKSEAIAPTMAYDDGRFTYLRFPNNRDFPAAFTVAADKSESIVNSHIDPAQPEILVLHRVAREMVLRLGDQVVGIYNERFDPNGIAPKNGTTVPGVERVILSGEATQ